MVAIKGMEMPNRCDECQCAVGSECPFLRVDVEEEMGSRDMNCPLVEIITCKNCDHYEDILAAIDKDGNKKILHFCKKYRKSVSEDFYCADAESED